MQNQYAIIMAGGVGTRFWPFSRNNNPKQFHDILGTGKTLLQQTVERFDGICPIENIYIVTNEIYFDLVKQQLPQLRDEQILCEPARRNTAPCIAYACYKIASRNPNANIVVAPADHIILKEDVFRQKLQIALDATQNQAILVTLGITPTRPDTGYGYIQFEESEDLIHKVKKFTEKPNLETAEQFLSQGDFVWNAGIFVWNASSIKQAFAKHLPQIDTDFTSIASSFFTPDEKKNIGTIYPACENISIDYGIMEKSDNVFVVLSDFGWSDLGTWKSLYEASVRDENQNVIEGQVMQYDTKNCIIKTSADKLVVVQGLDGYIVAEHDGVIMICKLSDEQRVKKFVADAEKINKKYI